MHTTQYKLYAILAISSFYALPATTSGATNVERLRLEKISQLEIEAKSAEPFLLLL